MKKKILSLIVSAAMVMTVFAGMTVTASADEAAAPAAFTVYTADVDGDNGTAKGLKVVKEYTAAEFEAMATTDTITTMYNNKTVVSTGKSVAVSRILDDAKIDISFISGLYGFEGGKIWGKPGRMYPNYKDYLTNDAYFYGKTEIGGESTTVVSEGATTVPFVVALNYSTSEKGAAGVAESVPLGSVNDNYMFMMGSFSTEDSAAGIYFVTGPTGIVVDVDEDAMTAAAKKLTVKNLTVKGSKAKAAVKYKKTAGAEKYKITYSKNKKFTKAATKYTTKTSYTLKLKKGTYYIKVAAGKKVDGKNVYGKYSRYKKVVVK